ncbi:metallophosphoesterase [Nannocystis bainbridge]|uniref:Metallophosphoesterase n=1 Tax=Nannocystis bainbridge TaxID=2995303 RepID=A0ABT5E156_9BACT|nr:metallophosphoesterase [Nannocystis bainbridge]MDC0719158.1 metallophosphoesterase [Nannocystis bainbridge]
MSARRLAPVLVLFAACSPPTAGGTDDASSGSEATGTTAPTGTTTTSSGELPDPTTTGTTGDDSTTSTSEPLPEPLAPLEGPVPLTDEVVRVPTHPVDEDKLLDLRLPADVATALAEGYGDVMLAAGEPVLPRTLDDAEPPTPGAAPKLLVRFVHLADTQLADDESPARLASFDEVSGGAFRPQEGHVCRMLNAGVRTINALHVDDPLDFVLLGGDNTDNAQTNELEWFLGILNGAPAVECDSAIDDDPLPGPDNDPKDRFAPVGLDVPWRWVAGNHDVLRQGTFGILDFSEPIGDASVGGTRDYGQPGAPIVKGMVPADPARAFLTEPEQVAWVAGDGDGHGLDAAAVELGRAFYTFDVAGTPLRFFVLNTSSLKGSSQGLIRAVDLEAIIGPTLDQAVADDKWVIVTSHHRSGSLGDGQEFGIGTKYDDALTAVQWQEFLGSYDNVILHLAAHTHRLMVEAMQPAGGHAYWEMVTPSLNDFPSQMRVLEVWDQDNGALTIQARAFDMITDDDPVAEMGRTLAIADFTSGWENDGRGTGPDQRNVALWIAAPE